MGEGHRRKDKWILKTLLAVSLPEGLAVSQTAQGLSKGEVTRLSNSPSPGPPEGSVPRTKEGKPITLSLFFFGPDSMVAFPGTLSDLLQRQKRQETWVPTEPGVGPGQAPGAVWGFS